MLQREAKRQKLVKKYSKKREEILTSLKTSKNLTDMSNWKEIIPHNKDVHLLDMEIFDNHLVLSERENGLRGLRIINLITGNQHSVDFGEDAVKHIYKNLITE